LLERFASIRREEAVPTVVAGLFFFCVLTALMVVRPAREALGMQRGIEAVRWLFIGTAVVTLLVNPVFGFLVSRFRRRVFVNATYLFFALGLVAFHALLVLAPAAVGSRTGQVFYVWFSVFNLFATMLFWALMADRFSLEQSKLLALGASALLRSSSAENPSFERAEHAVIGGSAWEGLQAVFRSPYLLGICAYVLIVAVMATFLYFTRLQMVAALGTDLDLRTTMFARIDMITQVATLVLQALVTGHLMQRLGVAVALALLPLTAALGFLGLALAGSLAALVAFEATFRAVQRGIMRPARETLFTIVARTDRYKAKAFIDTFVYRAGDVAGAQTEGLLARLGMGLAALASLAVPLAAAWLALGLWLGYAQRSRATREPQAMPLPQTD
jgi:AAA family ATP:ADP antiporter